jgi:SAM-dependent methyltransferase
MDDSQLTEPTPESASQITAAVQRLYNTYPFPADPLSDSLPPGYNWRWSWEVAHSFCTGRLPASLKIRILDAGCGTGSSTEYLCHLNPEAQVVGIDLSEQALAVAQQRVQRSGLIQKEGPKPEWHHLSLYDVEQLPGQFQFINCVGVLHHLPDPQRGLQALATKLAPGGLMHIFVYAELGRWEIRLVQEAIRLLQGNQSQDLRRGLQIGRQLFASLPRDNRLVQYEQRRWAQENQRDEHFADMYLHPQEIDYNIAMLFDLIQSADLTFVAFSDPQTWMLERLLGSSPELLEVAASLPTLQRYRLMELLDPDISHFEFFLAKPPTHLQDWSNEQTLLSAQPLRNPCMYGWPGLSIMDHDYQPQRLTQAEFSFLQASDDNPEATVADLLASNPLSLAEVRSLHQRLLLLLRPCNVSQSH